MDEENPASNNGDDGLSSSSIETSSSNDAMESGRKAALKILKSLNDDNEEDDNNNPQTTEEQSNETLETIIGHSSTQQFTFPSRKSHCLTICLVPPPTATTAWERLTDVRRELEDPGFFRWPPHANLLYPFLVPIFDIKSEKSKEEQNSEFRKQLSISLTSVAAQCKPFDVEIDTFGTFGGESRGVLWAHPKSRYSATAGADYDSDEEPLVTLQTKLEKHFPTCTDQRKQGSFTPHITLSHYANITDALEAKEQVESKWESTSFSVPEIYLLERNGDEGQFKILAKIPLGLEESDEVNLFDEPLAFPAMPVNEEEWVYNERMAMKNRRKKNFKRRRSPLNEQ
jgi:2'-5' RNA ligase